MEDPILNLDQYSLPIIILYILVKEIWPFVRDKWFPQYSEDRKRLREKITDLEERNVIAIEKLAVLLDGLVQNYIITNERLNRIETGVSRHDNITGDFQTQVVKAIARMEERTRPRPSIKSSRSKGDE